MTSDGAPDLLAGVAPDAAPATQLPDVSVQAGTATAQWGIFATGTGTSVIDIDSVVELEYRAEWRTQDYPIEDGSFSTFNKVAAPFQVPLRIVKSGDAAARTNFMGTLDAIGKSLDLYDVVTPERAYIGVNIERIGYRRTATNGVELIMADVWLKEIRLASDPQFSKTASQSGQDPVINGTVQPQPATAAQQKTVTDSAATSLTAPVNTNPGKAGNAAEAFSAVPGGW